MNIFCSLFFSTFYTSSINQNSLCNTETVRSRKLQKLYKTTLLCPMSGFIKFSCTSDGFDGLGVACCPLVPKFASSNPAETEKILSTPSFAGEVKPSVPCSRFAACKRSLNLSGSRNLGKITTRYFSRPQFHFSLLGSLASLWTEAPSG